MSDKDDGNNNNQENVVVDDDKVGKDEDDNLNESKNSKKRRKRKRKRSSKNKESIDNDDDDDNVNDDKDIVNNNNNESSIIDNDEKKKIDEVDRTVFIEGIPYQCNENDIYEFFQQNGINIHDIIDVRLPTWQDSGRLRGYGHVVFQSKTSYDIALQLSGKYLNGRYLNIDPAKKPKNTVNNNNNNIEPSNTIALHNLSYNANEDDIEQIMKQYGTIINGGVRVVRHSNTNNSKGFAYVQYDDIESAKNAYNNAKNNIIICNRKCRIDYDHGRIKGSFRTVDRKLWQKEYGRNNNNNNKKQTQQK